MQKTLLPPFLLLLFLTLFGGVQSQPTPDDPCDLASIGITGPFTYKRGDRVPVCVILGRLQPPTEENETPEERFVPEHKTLFWPALDDFSLLEITDTEKPGGFSPIADDDTAIRIQIGESVSPVRRRGNGNHAVPFWTLVQALDRGRPDYAEWDGGCLGCSSDLASVLLLFFFFFVFCCFFSLVLLSEDHPIPDLRRLLFCCGPVFGCNNFWLLQLH